MRRREFLKATLSAAALPVVPSRIVDQFDAVIREVPTAEFCEVLYSLCKSFKLGNGGFELIITTAGNERGGGTIIRLPDDGVETYLPPKQSDPVARTPDYARARIRLTCRPNRLWMRAEMLPGPILTPPLFKADWFTVEGKPEFDFFRYSPKQDRGAKQFLMLHSTPVPDTDSMMLRYAIFGMIMIMNTSDGQRLFVEAKMRNKAKAFARRN